MKLTGYQLREAIKAQAAKRDFAASQFSDTLKAFPGEAKPPPEAVMKQLIDSENALAALQVAQMRYNLVVPIADVPGVATLAQAIKLIGGIARAEKLWRGAASPKVDRYALHKSDERSTDTIVAKPTVAREAAHEHAMQLARHAAKLRQAIANANATVVEIDLDSGLLL